MKKMLVIIMMTVTFWMYGQVIYVDKNAMGMNNGMDWLNAFTTLQPALDFAMPGMQIWVAQGTYYPTNDYGLGIGQRGLHFRMKNMVEIYGGFSGWEFILEQRDYQNNVTVLSGDVGVPGVDTDNCYHVFFHSLIMLDPSAVLDGFTITKGRADDSFSTLHQSGAGMYNDQCSPTIRNCDFIDNFAQLFGGGMNNLQMSNPIITNSLFRFNTSLLNAGGGMNNLNSNPFVTATDFYENTSNMAGGIMNDTFTPNFDDCDIFDNDAVTHGGGMVNDLSSPMITNCSFYNNTAGMDGGGMYNFCSSNPQIRETQFYENSGYNGGAVYNDNSNPLISNCTIKDNSASNHGGGFYNYYSSPEIVNTMIFTNEASVDEGGLYDEYTDDLKLTNCLIYGNSSQRGEQSFEKNSIVTRINCTLGGPGGTYSHSLSNLKDYSVVIAQRDTSDTKPRIEVDVASTHHMFSSLYQNQPGDVLDHSGAGFMADPMCITGNPRFADESNRDYRLKSVSPCVNTGIEGFNPEIFDIRGENRIQNVTIDMGAYEWTDGIDPEPALYYVNHDASGADDGSSWTDAFSLLQSALDISEYGDQIWVAKGTYYPTYDHGLGIGTRGNHFRMIEGVEIFGGFDGTESELSERNFRTNVTILSGDIGLQLDNTDNCYHVVNNPPGQNIDLSARLDGFTVRDGFADGTSPHDDGGGIYNDSASPSIVNCRIIYNTAQNFAGGIMNNYSSPEIINCIIAHNKAVNGGGLYSMQSDSVKMINCLIYDNESENVSSMVSYASNVTRISCTIQEKMPESSGEKGPADQPTGPFSQSMANIHDYICVLAEPDTTSVDITLCDESSGYESTMSRVPEFFLNDVNFTNNGCFFDNPVFVDEENFDFRLFGTPLLIDAGLNNYNDHPYDVRGEDRIQGGTIDIGAYEWTDRIDPENLGTPLNFDVAFVGTDRQLSWDIVDYADLYRVYRSSDPYSGFAEVGTSAVNSFTDEEVVAGNKYFYYVKAVKE